MKKINSGLTYKNPEGAETINSFLKKNPVGRLSIQKRIEQKRSLEKTKAHTKKQVRFEDLSHTENSIRMTNGLEDNYANRYARKHKQNIKVYSDLVKKIQQKTENKRTINLFKIHNEIINTIQKSSNLKEEVFLNSSYQAIPSFSSNQLKQIRVRQMNTSTK